MSVVLLSSFLLLLCCSGPSHVLTQGKTCITLAVFVDLPEAEVAVSDSRLEDFVSHAQER